MTIERIKDDQQISSYPKPEEREIQVRIVLNGEMAQRFNLIKKRFGLNSNAEVVRLMITLEHEKITNQKMIRST